MEENKGMTSEVMLILNWLDGYENGVKDFIEYLNNNAFELRHDMGLIRKYAVKFMEL